MNIEEVSEKHSMELQLKKIELSDKDWMNEYLGQKQDKGCDMCFPNIYLWGRKYQTGYAIVEDCLIFADRIDLSSVSFPLGSPENVKKAIAWLEEYFASMGKPFSLHLVGEGDFALLEQWFPGKYQITYERDLADYVYETEKLISLSGKKYHGKKNHINKFKSIYPDWSYEPITDDNVEECFQMAMKWRRDNGCEEDEEKLDELCVALNALRLMHELELKGGLIRAEGNVVAFAVGEELNEDMFVVHIEKAFADVPGAYPIINQQFALHEGAGYPYINREDDSGVEGLRRAKTSYHPVFLREKGLVTHA
jgi:hypothetical protein